MKKVIVGLGAVGAVIALRAAVRSGGRKMREHCRQMTGKCKPVMAGQSGEGREAAPMREHCREVAARFADSSGTVAEHVRPEEVAANI